MTRNTSAALLLLLALAGCTTVEVELLDPPTPLENPHKGAMLLKCLRDDSPEKLANGYLFTIQRNVNFNGAYESSSAAPTSVTDLDAGIYQVTITGKHINPVTADVQVWPGKLSQVVLWVRNARNASNLEDTAEVTGKVLLYTVLCVVYAVVWVASDWSSSDDDECPRCHHTVCTCAPASKRNPPASVGPYRNPK